MHIWCTNRTKRAQMKLVVFWVYQLVTHLFHQLWSLTFNIEKHPFFSYDVFCLGSTLVTPLSSSLHWPINSGYPGYYVGHREGICFFNVLVFSELEEGQTLRELSPLNRSLKQKEGAIVEWGSEPLSCCMTFKVLFYSCPRKKENKTTKLLVPFIHHP